MRQRAPLYAFRIIIKEINYFHFFVIMDNNDPYTAVIIFSKRLTALIMANYVNSTTVVSITYGYKTQSQRAFIILPISLVLE